MYTDTYCFTGLSVSVLLGCDNPGNSGGWFGDIRNDQKPAKGQEAGEKAKEGRI